HRCRRGSAPARRARTGVRASRAAWAPAARRRRRQFHPRARAALLPERHRAPAGWREYRRGRRASCATAGDGACPVSTEQYDKIPTAVLLCTSGGFQRVVEMAEWLKADAWKACIPERVSWVRIPLSPPFLPVSG